MALPNTSGTNGATAATDQKVIDAELADWIYFRADNDQGFGLAEIESGAAIYNAASFPAFQTTLRNQGFTFGPEGFVYDKATGFCCAVVQEANGFAIVVRGTDIGTSNPVAIAAAVAAAYAGFPSTSPGTIDQLDIAQDISQGEGTLAPTQIQDLLNVISALRQATPSGTNIRLVGQSLGGGDAAAASILTGIPADVFDPAPFSNQIKDEAIRSAAKNVGVTDDLKGYYASAFTTSVHDLTVGDFILANYGASVYLNFLLKYDSTNQTDVGNITASRVGGEFLTSGSLSDYISFFSNQIAVANLKEYDVGYSSFTGGSNLALHSPSLIALCAATASPGTFSGKAFAALLAGDATLYDAFVGASQGNTGAESHNRSDDATAAGTSKVQTSGADSGILLRALLKTVGQQTGLYNYFSQIFGGLFAQGAVAGSLGDKDPNDVTLHTAFERLALDVFRDDVSGTSNVDAITAKNITGAIGGGGGTPQADAVIIHKSDINATSTDQLAADRLQYGETTLNTVVWNDLQAAVGQNQLVEQILGKRHDKIFGSDIQDQMDNSVGSSSAQGLGWSVAVAQAGSTGNSFQFDPNDTSTGARSGDVNQNLLIFGGAGTNTIKGGNKNDIIVTGDGPTTIQASNGNAIIVAGKGATKVNAGNGTNTIIGGSGNLTLTALTSAGSAPSTTTTETLLGGSGNCIVSADCSVKTGPSAVLLEGGTGTNTFNLTGVENQKHGPYGSASSFFVMWGGGGNTTYNVSYGVPANQAGYLAFETVAVTGLTRNDFFDIDTQKLISYLDAQGILTTQPTYGADFNGIILRSAGDTYNVSASSGSNLTIRNKDNVVDVSQFLKPASAVDPTLGNGGTNYFNSSSSDVTLDFGLGNNSVWHGGDTFGETFTYASSDGNDVIDVFTKAGSSDTLSLTNLTAANVSLAVTEGVNLTITDKTTGETIRVLNQYLDATGRYGLKTLVFSDGSSVDLSQVSIASLVRNAGSSYLYDGISNSNVSLKGGVYLVHNQGEAHQTYVYHSGDGSSVINGFTSAQSTDTLSLADLTQTQVTLSKVANDLIVTATASGDILRIENQFAGSGYGVGSIAFADGTTLTSSQFAGKATNGGNPSSYVSTTSSNTTITMSAANQTFAHSPNVSGETYLYARSDGNAALDLQTSASSTDVLSLTDCKLSDVSGAIVDGYNLRLTVNSTGKTITLLDEFLGSSGQYGVTSVSFQDATLSRSTLLKTFSSVGTAGSTYIYVPLSGNSVQAGPGDQYITHSKGESHQTYVYAKGDGNDVISSTTPGGSSDVLKLANLNASDVILRKSGQDLLVQTTSSGQSIRVKGQFADNSFGIASISFANGRIYDRQTISSVASSNTATLYSPVIDGVIAGQTATDSNVVTPFVTVTVTDPNSSATETLNISLAGATGYLSDGSSFSGLMSAQVGSYTLKGTASQVTAELQALRFTPLGNQPNTTATTTFNLLDTSSAGTFTSDATTTVLDKVSPAAPLIAGTKAGQITSNEAPVTPFANVIVVDPNASGTLTVAIQITGSGSLSDGAQYSGLKTTSTTGLYTLSGSDAALTAELQALTFKPASSGTSSFKISVTSSAGTSTVDNTTTIIDQSSSGVLQPTLSGTIAGQTTTAETVLKPFSGVTIADSNAGATETLTITLGGSGGTLTDGAGFNKLVVGGAGTYTLSGTAAAVTSELDALVFKPTAAPPNSTATSTFKLVDASSAGPSVTDTTTTVIDRNPFGPDVGTAYAPPAGSDTLSCDGTYPFDYTVTGQHTITFQAGVDSNVQVDATNYGSRSYGDVFKYARADGNVSIRDTSGASDVMEFTDLKSTDVTFSSVYATYETSGTGWSSLAINVAATGKTVTIDNWNRTDAAYGPTTFIFSDGMSLTRSQILTTEQNQTPSAAQYRFDGAYTTTHLTGQYGGAPVADVWFDQNNDTVYASSGVNTYHYASTNGTIQIFDTTVQQGVLNLSNLNASDVTLSRTGTSSSDLLVKVNATGKTIDVAGQFNNQGISAIVFANATRMTAAQIASATATAVAPTISGTVAGQTTTAETVLKPFSGVTIADSNAGATETLTITVGGSGGTLADGAGFNKLAAGGTAGIYTLSGTAAAVTSELDALVFKPTAAAPNSTATATFKLVDASSAGTSVTDTTTTVIDRNPFGSDVGAAYVPQAGSDTLSCDGTYPFDYSVTGQHTITFQAGVDSNVQVDVANYGSRSYGDIFKYSRADGNVSIRDTSGASDVMEFTDLKSTDVTFTPVYSTYETSGTGWSSLAISVAATGKTVTIDNWSRTDAAYGPQTMIFADGVTLTRSQILAAEPNQTPSAAQYRFDGAYTTTHLTGQYGGAPVADVWFDQNNDTVYASSGVNTYHYASTNGTIQVFDTTSQQGVLNLSNLNASDVTLSRTGTSSSDLLVKVNATGKTIDVAGQFNNQGISAIVFANATRMTAAQIASATALPPTISGLTSSLTTTSTTAVKAFSGVTVGDVNGTGITDALTIQITGGGGTLKDGTGFSGLKATGTAGVYTLTSASATNVTKELNALLFTPPTSASSTSNFYLTDASSAGPSASVGALKFSGTGQSTSLAGTTAVAITDLGHALTVAISSNTQTDTISGFGTTDTTGIINFKNGVGGFSAASDVVNALHSDGHGGSLLTLGANGSIDFLSTPTANLHASNFKIG